MKQKISFIYKILILIICGIGLYLNFSIAPIRQNIIYFTIQSNLFCFIFYLIIIVLKITNRLKKNNIYYIFKGMATMSITITMFVYQLVLSTSGTMDVYANHMMACNFVHLIVPLMVMIDYVIFGEKGNLKVSYPFIWSLVLVAYLLFWLIYISLGGTFLGGTKYPYYYMDIEKYGILRVIINNLMVYIFFVGYGFIIQSLDNYFGKGKI